MLPDEVLTTHGVCAALAALSIRALDVESEAVPTTANESALATQGSPPLRCLSVSSRDWRLVRARGTSEPAWRGIELPGERSGK